MNYDLSSGKTTFGRQSIDFNRCERSSILNYCLVSQCIRVLRNFIERKDFIQEMADMVDTVTFSVNGINSSGETVERRKEKS